ncbi:UDP-N-acetylmuramate dehydrogenase [Candidatus Saccharibacteria bacterium]|nr:UDP-N-acetylmuramate dehydrogenase [Candidatus Saccharibacteria bacterium]
MSIAEHVPLSGYSTMRLGGQARYLTEIKDRSEIEPLLIWAREHRLSVVMIGNGTNIVWGDKGFAGLVLVNRIRKFEVLKQDDSAYITAGAGENWDHVVGRVVALGYSGIEELSLIPGTTGATPVQNVGAYGREISEVLATVEAFDRQTNQFVTLRGSDCGFGYRTSRFKTSDKGRFFITAISLYVGQQPSKQPFYPSLQTYFTEHSITTFSPQVIRNAVIAIRSAKLPNPAQVANNGSFFENPIISEEQLRWFTQNFPGVIYWLRDNGSAKLSAAWLIEQAGFKDVHDQATGMATWPKQALVLVNEHAHHTEL